MKNNLSTLVIVGDLKEIFYLGGGGGKLANSVGGGVAGQKKKYPDLSFPEVSISDIILFHPSRCLCVSDESTS